MQLTTLSSMECFLPRPQIAQIMYSGNDIEARLQLSPARVVSPAVEEINEIKKKKTEYPVFCVQTDTYYDHELNVLIM